LELARSAGARGLKPGLDIVDPLKAVALRRGAWIETAPICIE